MQKQARTRKLEIAAVEIETPAVLRDRSQEYAQRQRERVVTAVTPRVKEPTQEIAQPPLRVERQELQIEAQAQREQMSKALLAHLRQVDLGTVMTALGGERDPNGWRLGGEVISITGEKFYNHTRKQGGNGAIDLLVHTQSYSYREAVAWLHHQVGTDVAVVAAARHALAIIESEPLPSADAGPGRHRARRDGQ